MKKGLIVGKFYPPHAGHDYLIETGAKNCDQLTVLVCDRPEHLIPGKLRAKWLQQAHPNVDVRCINDSLDDNDSPAWAKYSLEQMDGKIDVVFTSESYGKTWAEAIGCEHYQVDIDRTAIPCSGTAVREDPFKMWEYLSEPVRAYFAFRVCVVGAESTGKTTLSKDIANYYKTVWVPEYGRTYTEQIVDDVWNYKWQTSDFVKIAHTQARQEDMAASKANKVLVCDTDVFATSIWHKRYMGFRSPEVEKIATNRPKMDIYILTDPLTPFKQDGLRDGENIRNWMHEQFVASLEFWGKDYVFVSGDRQQRLTKAVAIIDKLMATNSGLSGKELKI